MSPFYVLERVHIIQVCFRRKFTRTDDRDISSCSQRRGVLKEEVRLWFEFD